MSETNTRLRIIGGRWRRRPIMLCPDAPTRPTPARLRETLFNWLGHPLTRQNCLDLFAGSGALSFEALSRGAHHATLVEQQAAVCATLKQQVALFDAKHKVKIIRDDAFALLKKPFGEPSAPYDLIFLDPPFASDLLENTLARLDQRRELFPPKDTLVYIEYQKNSPPAIPAGWFVRRETTVADVGGALLQIP